jgi:hypothetical protein
VAHCLQCRGRDRWGVSGGIEDEDKTVDSPEQLTVTMFRIKIKQLLEPQMPVFLIVLEIEYETDFVEPHFSFRIHSGSFEGYTLPVDPIGQCRVFLVILWNIACNSGRAAGGVLEGVLKMKVKRSTAQNNSQLPCFS